MFWDGDHRVAEVRCELQRLPLGAEREIGYLEQLPARGLQAAHHHFGHAHDECVTEVVIILAMLAQSRSVDEQHFDGLDGAGIEMPKVRREQP